MFVFCLCNLLKELTELKVSIEINLDKIMLNMEKDKCLMARKIG